MKFVQKAAICALILHSRKKRQKKMWVHPLISQRLIKGQFHKLYSDLCMYPEKFFGYFRMSKSSFDELLRMIQPHITYKNTNMRMAVSPEERLAVTLRYLATGNSFHSLHYEYLLGVTTIREILRTTCEAIWLCLQPIFMAEKSEEDWVQTANEFDERTNFPHCIGAVDGKHIRMCKPDGSGSAFFNYKSFFSIVLMALVDADYCFTSIEVGSYGASSDSNIFKQSNLWKKLEKDQLNVPQPRILPNDDKGKAMPFVIVGDEAFALSHHVLRPYPRRNLSVPQRIFNYRLRRARRMVECTFGILCNKWRIFHRAIDVHPDFCDSIVKTCCVLHNFVRKRDGIQFEDTLCACPLDTIDPIGTRSTVQGAAMREYLTNYFISPLGALPWQYDKI